MTTARPTVGDAVAASGGLVKITDEWHKRDLARAVHGSFFENGAWWLDLDKADDDTKFVLVTLFPVFHEIVDVAALFDEVRPVDHASPWVASAYDDPRDGIPDRVPTKNLLYTYQAVGVVYAVARARADGGSSMAWPRGMGKTIGALTWAMALGGGHTIVVMPNTTKLSVWRPEVIKWGSGYWHDRDIYVIEGSKAKREKALREFSVPEANHPKILLVHYEALRLFEWAKVPCDQLIVDEAHRLAKGAARGRGVPQFYKALKQINATYKLELTGSVMTNGPEDVFGQAHLLFPDRYKSKWKDWNNRFLRYISGSHGEICVGVKPEMRDEFRYELGAWMHVLKREDHLDLPVKTEQDLYVDLTPAQRRVYDEMERTFMAELPDGELVLTTAVIARLTKLRQIASGLDLLGEGFTDSSKLDLAMDLIQDTLPYKTVVFCWHKAAVRAMCDRLTKAGITNVGITGDTKHGDRAVIIEDFQTKPSVKVLVATISTLGEGVTLHAAADLIFVESSWDPTSMEQAADRVYRIGQDRPVTITRIIARDTVDAWNVIPTVETKAALKRALIGG